MIFPTLLQLPTTLPDLTDAALQYRHANPPDPTTWCEVTSGVYWLRMPLPFALDHINLWLIRDEIAGRAGFTLVDTGIYDAVTQAIWQQLWRGPMQGLPILRVICTHLHPDHFGLADWLCTHFACALWMTAGEYGIGRVLSAALPGADSQTMMTHFARHGVTESSVQAELRERGEYFSQYVPSTPATFCRLEDGQAIIIGGKVWQIIIGRGHSPEHASLFCAELALLIAGDMLLPRISTNLSVFGLEPEANPIPQFIDSLRRFLMLPANTLVLPSHGLPFWGIATRVTQLEIHHAERLREVLELCKRPLSARALTPFLFKRTLDVHQLSFALGETLAHLHCLRELSLVKQSQRADGVIEFQTVID